MRAAFHLRNLLLPVLLLCAMAALVAGCATTEDSDNRSEKPWNSPKSWENGLPSEMFEGR